MIPLPIVISLSTINFHKIRLNMISIIANSANRAGLTVKGDKAKTNPNINVKLMIHEPKILPNARLIYLFLTAAKLTVSSGSDVPIAITVAPITD